MGEDREEDAVHAGFVLKDAHGAGCSAHFSETPLDGVGGSHNFSLLSGLISKAVQQLVGIVSQAGDGLWIYLAPAIGEALCGGARLA